MKNIKHYFVQLSFVLSIIVTFQSCDQDSKKRDQQKATIVNANDELFNKGNVDFADQVFAAEYAKAIDIKEFVSLRRKAFPDLQVKIEPVLAEGDMVAWLRTSTGTQTGDYMGRRASSRKITWKEMIFSQYSPEGKVTDEWSVSNVGEMLDGATSTDGIFEYLPPLKGQSINRNGRFVYLFGPSSGKGNIISQAGTQVISGDTVKNTITFCSDQKQVGTGYWWRMKAQSGDTITYELMDQKGRITGEGRAVKIGE
jgi:predicted ester cyclase